MKTQMLLDSQKELTADLLDDLIVLQDIRNQIFKLRATNIKQITDAIDLEIEDIKSNLETLSK